MKSVVFLSQMGFIGKIPRNHSNMRVEFAQMCSLQANHVPLLSINQVNTKFDVAIFLASLTISISYSLSLSLGVLGINKTAISNLVLT